MTFTKGVLCSLSILDRYGDSIACLLLDLLLRFRPKEKPLAGLFC